MLAWLIGIALGSSSKRAAWIGAATASLWLVHPLNLTAVAYIVQRMTSLSALFTALAILAYVSERFAQRSRPGRWLRTIVLVAGFGLLAAFSKETGLLTPVYLIVIELVVFRFRAADTRDTRTAKTLVVIVLSSLALVMVLYPILHSNPLNGYAARPFDLEQRLLTEARVVSWYLAMLLVPDVQQMTLYHDGLRVSAGLLAPPTTLFALAALVTLLLGAIALRHRAPWFSFGMLFFFAGHLLESTVFPLELVFEHRNYLPSFGVLFAIVTGAALGLKRLEVPPRFQALAPVPFIVILSVATHIRAHQWSGDPAAPLIDALNHPESPRANIIAGNTFSLLAKGAEYHIDRRGLIDLADQAFKRADGLLPDSANAIFGWLFLYYEHGIDPPEQLVQSLEDRLARVFIDASTINGLHSLTTCQIDGHCRIPEANYLDAMNAALQNPRLTPGFKVPVLRDLARFYAEHRQDYGRAIAETRKALALDHSKLETRVELINYLANNGQVSEALAALRELEQADQLGRFSAQIPKWRALLTSADAAGQARPDTYR